MKQVKRHYNMKQALSLYTDGVDTKVFMTILK